MQRPSLFQTPTTPTSGSIGPAGSTMSGLSCPGSVTVEPSFMRKRRLKDPSFDPLADAATGFGPSLIGRADGLDHLFLEPFQVFRVGARRLLIGQRLYQRRAVVIFSRQDHADRAGRMGMQGADENGLRRDTAPGVDRLPHRRHHWLANDQGVDADQGHPLLAVVEHGRPDFARIVQDSVEYLAVSAGPFHADLRRDVTFGEPDFQQRLGRRRAELVAREIGPPQTTVPASKAPSTACNRRRSNIAAPRV